MPDATPSDGAPAARPCSLGVILLLLLLLLLLSLMTVLLR
jgi:hypothetical protein